MRFVELALLALIYASLFGARAHFVADRRSFDGERYTSVCAGVQHMPRTFACVEVPR